MEVQAQAWERFQAEWSKYTEALKQQPEFWRKIAAQHDKLSSGFGQFGAKFDAHLDALQEAKDVQEDSEKSLTHTAALWGGIEKASASTTKSILSGTTSLLKWSGLLSGIGGLLGYLSVDGMMHLGSSVYGQRKSSMGLGLTVGQQRAFDIALGPLLGSPQGFLSGINAATTDISSPGYVGLATLGVNPNGSTSQVATRTLEAVRALALRTPLNELGIAEQNYHLGDLGIGVEDFRRFKSMGASQFNSYIGDVGKWQDMLNLSASSTAAWTRFMLKMEVAGTEIENVFVKGLQPLAGPLSNLAGGFSHLLQAVMRKNGGIEKDINSIADWMNAFNGQITKPKFISGLERFVDLVSVFGSVSNVGHVTPPAPGSRGFWATLFEGPTPGSVLSRFQHETAWAFGMYGKRSHWMDVARQMDPSGLLFLVGNLESGMNPYVPDSSKGAMGMMQIMPNVARAAGINPYDPEQSLGYANTELDHLNKEYHGNISKVLAAYNWGEGNLNRDISRYGNAWQQHLPPETMNYLAKAIAQALGGSIKVQIVNATGGSATASVAALGASR